MDWATVQATMRMVGADLTAGGLVVPGTGNLSVWSPEAIYVTREGAALHRLVEDDICAIGRTTAPPVAMPAQDTPIHRAIYTTSGGGAIIHAHGPHTIIQSLAAGPFMPPDLEGRNLLGEVPVVSPRRNVVDVIAKALETAVIVLVAGHGTYARGRSLDEALRWTALLEASARIATLLRISRDGNDVQPAVPALPNDATTAPGA